MFIWQIRKGAKPFSYKEDVFVKKMLIGFRDHCQRYGAFLNQLELNKIQFLWSQYMLDHIDAGVMGAWGLSQPRKIYILPFTHTVLPPNAYAIGDEHGIVTGSHLLMPDLGKTVVHEVTHLWQFKIAPVRYILNRLFTVVWEHLPFLNYFTLEGDVDRNTEVKEVEEFFQQLSLAYDNYVYYRRCAKKLEVCQADPTKTAEEIHSVKEMTRCALEQFESNETCYVNLAQQLFDTVK